MNNKNKNVDRCSCTVIHEEIVNEIKSNMIREKTTIALAEFFKVFSDPTRLGIIYALSKSEMCVCDLSALLRVSQSAVSHQLKVLRQSRLVKYRRDGKVVYYSLDDDHIKQVFDQGLAHIEENYQGSQS